MPCSAGDDAGVRMPREAADMHLGDDSALERPPVVARIALPIVEAKSRSRHS